MEYWCFTLFVLFLTFAVAYPVGLWLAESGREPSIAFLPLVPLYIPGWTVSVRRLHDTGRSGWSLLVQFVPLIGGFILLRWMFQDSQPVGNFHGPSPKGSAVASRPRPTMAKAA